ncbi:hypothetical protein [Microbispora sp. GKU 823]|uniref:hypothetical protein n=1 Tax=Microbispora sp. GKU 823 TaxID=1652100 RepID=UPI00117BFA5C|nr:hypothetical protein [Microbispora sp. GKU 823]
MSRKKALPSTTSPPAHSATDFQVRGSSDPSGPFHGVCSMGGSRDDAPGGMPRFCASPGVPTRVPESRSCPVTWALSRRTPA